MLLDAARGLMALHHHTPVIIHKDFKSANLLVDAHQHVKLADFNISSGPSKGGSLVGSPPYMAPEVISKSFYSPASDIYAFGIVMWEVLTRQRPYTGMLSSDIREAVSKSRTRPQITASIKADPTTPSEYLELMEECWIQNPNRRPAIQEIYDRLMSIKAKYESDINVQHAVDAVSNAKTSISMTLQEMVPVESASVKLETYPEAFNELGPGHHGALSGVTVLMTRLSSDILDKHGPAIDKLVSIFNVERMPTRAINDDYKDSSAFIIVGGLEPHDTSCDNVIDFAVALMGLTSRTIKIGVHTGTVVASHVGNQKSLMGETLYTASHLHRTGEAGVINISQSCYDSVGESVKCKYFFEPFVNLRYDNVMSTYVVTAKSLF